MARSRSIRYPSNTRLASESGAGHSAPSGGADAPSRTRYSRQAKSDEARAAHTTKKEQLSDGERKALERLASRAPRQKKAKSATSSGGPNASVEVSATGTEPASLDSIFLCADDVLQASEVLAELSGAASRASSAATAQQEQHATDVQGTSKPAASVLKNTTVPRPTSSSQEAAMPTTTTSQMTDEAVLTSAQDNGADSPAPAAAAVEPISAANSGEQGTAAAGASAMPAGKTAKPTQTDLPVRRRQRKPAAPRSSMPCAVHEMPAPEKPRMQRAATGNSSQPQPATQKERPTKKCRKGPENLAPSATVQPKARNHRPTRTAEQQMGGAAHSTESINAAATPPQTRSRKRARAALAEMENGGTAAAAAATSGQATMTVADISAHVTDEEGTPAKRRRDAAPKVVLTNSKSPAVAAPEARAVPQQPGGSADHQSPATSAASAGELGAQQAADMEVDGVPTAETRLPAPARRSRPPGRGAKRGRKTGKAASAAAAPTAPITGPSPSPDVEANTTTMAAPIKAASPRRVLRVRQNTNTSTSLENCPPSPPRAKMPQAPVPQMSSLGRAGGMMKAVAEEGMIVEDSGAKPATGSERNTQKKRGHRDVQELCSAPQRVLRPRRR